MTTRIPVDRYRALRVAGALVGLAGLTVMLGACTHTADQVATASIPEDYRLRHPIAVQEANQSVVILVGHARGGLSADQRADVIGLARTWRHDATGPITADVPIDTSAKSRRS
jgi:pilus assembly protein CpaD